MYSDFFLLGIYKLPLRRIKWKYERIRGIETVLQLNLPYATMILHRTGAILIAGTDKKAKEKASVLAEVFF